MTLSRTLILSGALALATAGSAFADDASARIQAGQYAAQARSSGAVLQEGRASVGPLTDSSVSVAAQSTNANSARSSDPFYFQQANARQNR
jgi:hypothetical protein